MVLLPTLLLSAGLCVASRWLLGEAWGEGYGEVGGNGLGLGLGLEPSASLVSGVSRSAWRAPLLPLPSLSLLLLTPRPLLPPILPAVVCALIRRAGALPLLLR